MASKLQAALSPSVCCDLAVMYVSRDLGGAGAIEGVSLQDVSTGGQELIVDVSNDIRAGDDQQVIVASQLMSM